MQSLTIGRLGGDASVSPDVMAATYSRSEPAVCVTSICMRFAR